MISETAAFETAWAELSPILTALPPAHLDITRRIGRILFNDGVRGGMDVGAGIALSVLRESSVTTNENEANAEEGTAIPPVVIVNFNGRKISASRTDTLADIARMLLGDLPDGADVALQIESVGSIECEKVNGDGLAEHAAFTAGDLVSVDGVIGNTVVNGQWPIGVVQHRVTVISDGVSYFCTLNGYDEVEVSAAGDLLAFAKWNTKTGDHEDLLFARCDHPIDYDHLNSILAHASDAWRKHRR